MPSNESAIAVMKSDINYIKEDIKEIKLAVNKITNELPKKADRIELECKADRIDLNNITKANGLQRYLTNVLICASSVLITSLVMFWFANK